MKKNRKKIAIVGAGIFGCTLAFMLNEKFNVSIFEKKNDILNEASKMNQFRFHLGFHYPRSIKTIKETQKDYKDFLNFYGKDIYGETKNYYGLSKIKNKTNFKTYKKILIKNNLNFKKINNSEIFSKKIEGAILTKEKILNYFKLKKKINKLIKKKKIKIYFNREFKHHDKKKFDKIYLTTYKNNNIVLKNIGEKPSIKYRYELVEKLVIKLPKKYSNLSAVVLNGKFLCVDPYIGTKYHLLSHVKYSKIKILKSVFCNFPKKYKKYFKSQNKKNKKISQFNKVISDGTKYLPFLKKAKYVSSFYLVRTLNINSMKNDDRTNQMIKINPKIRTILSGKWNTAVSLAKNILKNDLKKFI